MMRAVALLALVAFAAADTRLIANTQSNGDPWPAGIFDITVIGSPRGIEDAVWDNATIVFERPAGSLPWSISFCAGSKADMLDLFHHQSEAFGRCRDSSKTLAIWEIDEDTALDRSTPCDTTTRFCSSVSLAAVFGNLTVVADAKSVSVGAFVAEFVYGEQFDNSTNRRRLLDVTILPDACCVACSTLGCLEDGSEHEVTRRDETFDGDWAPVPILLLTFIVLLAFVGICAMVDPPGVKPGGYASPSTSI